MHDFNSAVANSRRIDQNLESRFLSAFASVNVRLVPQREQVGCVFPDDVKTSVPDLKLH